MALLTRNESASAGVRNDQGRPGEARPGEFGRRETGPEAAEVRAGCIGRGHAGKTALFRALSEGPVGDFFPSGLHVDVGDPREVAQMIRESEETQRVLQASGLPPTVEASQIRYYLYDGDEQRVVYKMREVIGQVLTHTLPGSAPEQQARYDDYLKSLVNTHVLWVVVPCPPSNPSPRDRRRYANDLSITGAYLREALRLRTMTQPAAVALVLSKIPVTCTSATRSACGTAVPATIPTRWPQGPSAGSRRGRCPTALLNRFSLPTRSPHLATPPNTGCDACSRSDNALP